MQKETLAQIIDGKAIAQDIKAELKSNIQELKKNKATLREPGLAVILVGDDPASSFYVNKKQESCSEVGIKSYKTIVPATTTREELINIIEKYNAGICFEPENEADFIFKVMQLKTNQEKYQEQQKGCLKLAEAYDRKKLAKQMLSIIETYSIK